MIDIVKRKLPVYLCTETGCKHNAGGGYYGVCHHPITEIDRYVGGINRFYKSGCDLCEYHSTPKDKRCPSIKDLLNSPLCETSLMDEVIEDGN
mgnify:CR=1 FL=1